MFTFAPKSSKTGLIFSTNLQNPGPELTGINWCRLTTYLLDNNNIVAKQKKTKGKEKKNRTQTN